MELLEFLMTRTMAFLNYAWMNRQMPEMSYEAEMMIR
jgi:hypothetical protein